MNAIWILLVCSVVILPAMALWALRWALRHGEFRNLQKISLSIFDEEEPLGRLSDRFPGAAPEQAATPRAPGNHRAP